jgi:hypothetical protein
MVVLSTFFPFSDAVYHPKKVCPVLVAVGSVPYAVP